MTKGQAAPEVEHTYTQARVLCQQVGETPELVPVLFGLWRFYYARSQLHTARELGETLLRLAQHAHDPALAVIAHSALGSTWFHLGVLPAARPHLEEAIARYTPELRCAPVFRIAHDPGVGCRAYATTLWLGFFRASPGHISTTLVGARASHPYSLAVCAGCSGPVSQYAATCRLWSSMQSRRRALTEQGFHCAPMKRAYGGALPCRARARRDGPGTPGDAAWGHRSAAVPYGAPIRSLTPCYPEDGLQALAEAHTGGAA
jgi:hypothetical protein